MSIIVRNGDHCSYLSFNKYTKYFLQVLEIFKNLNGEAFRVLYRFNKKATKLIITDIWHSIREVAACSTWTNVVWHKLWVSKFSMTLWLVMKN